MTDQIDLTGGPWSGPRVGVAPSPRPTGSIRAPAERPLDAASLAEMLAGAPSGLAFIYRSLDAVVSALGLDDLAVVVESSGAGRQVFRRARFGRDTVASLLPSTPQLLDSPGLHAVPAVVPGDLSALLVHLCSVALRLDLLEHDASHDALTGLYNRRTYEQYLEQAVSRSERYGWPFGLVLLDIDDFKSVNDRHGHAVGDAVLRAVGGKLRASLRSGDVAARLGGDEFALLLLNADARTVLEPIAQRLRGALDRAVPEGAVRFSTGAAYFPDDAGDGANLMRLADARLYEEKARSGAHGRQAQNVWEAG